MWANPVRVSKADVVSDPSFSYSGRRTDQMPVGLGPRGHFVDEDAADGFGFGFGGREGGG